MLDQRPDQRFLAGLAPAARVGRRLGCDIAPVRLLKQQLAHHQRFRRRTHRLARRCGRMVLRLPGDGGTLDDHAVDRHWSPRSGPSLDRDVHWSCPGFGHCASLCTLTDAGRVTLSGRPAERTIW